MMMRAPVRPASKAASSGRTSTAARTPPAYGVDFLDLGLRTSGPVVQLARLNIRTGTGAGTISGVSDWPHRPPSNMRKAQGQHITAYVAFTDMILSNVRDRTVPQAAKQLIVVLKSIAALPSMAHAEAGLTKAIDINIDLLGKYGSDAATVGGVIDNILAIRNQAPGTAEQGQGGGHGEAKHAGILEVVETALRTKSAFDPGWGTEQQVIDQCRYPMWRLLDYQPADPGSGWGFDQKKFDTIAKKVLVHLKTMEIAYPEVFRWLSLKGAYLFDYLDKNRNVAGMPLQDLLPANLKTLVRVVEDGFK